MTATFTPSKTAFDTNEAQARRTASAFAIRTGATPGSDAYRKAYLERRASLARGQ